MGSRTRDKNSDRSDRALVRPVVGRSLDFARTFDLVAFWLPTSPPPSYNLDLALIHIAPILDERTCATSSRTAVQSKRLWLNLPSS